MNCTMLPSEPSSTPMACGRVYLWNPCGATGSLTACIVPLANLDDADCGMVRLSGRFARVRNGASVLRRNHDNEIGIVAMGDAEPDANGDFLFDPGLGGARVDKVPYVKRLRLRHYCEAARFGEVNTYYHLDRIASYIHGLLLKLGAVPLPRITATVNAHHAATEESGTRDGVWRDGRWLPFQGAHYRLPARRHDIPELAPLSPDGEIHLGPGRGLTSHGALAQYAGRPYRANASHNAGIIYHEYGHHITRHTADLRANRLRTPQRQSNRKSSLDEGYCDYWSASLLGTPHIWAWHRRHDNQTVHPRSLASKKTMQDYDERPGADPHLNGTIWAAALWELRTRMTAKLGDGGFQADLIIIESLLRLGQVSDGPPATLRGTRRLRNDYRTALTCLVRAEQSLAGSHRDLVTSTFAKRGIYPCTSLP